MTGLHLAVYFGVEAVVKLLLENVNSKASDGRTPLHWAPESGHPETAQLLLEKGANVNATDGDGSTPLHWASLNGHLETAELLLEKGADVNVATRTERTPLRLALGTVRSRSC
jgi:ankyrin repeat protein